MKLDEIDLRMLVILQEQGRITKTELANKIHLSVSPCHERLKRLEEAGLILGYHARIDIQRLARHSLIFVEVHLKQHHAGDFNRFEEYTRGVPEIVECYAIGGGIDYLLKMAVHDITQYQQKIEVLLEAELNIDRYYTYIVTKPIKHSGYPLEELYALNQSS